VKPEEVRALTATFEAAVHTNNDDTCAETAIKLFCGVALNLAVIAERLQAPAASPPG